MNNLRELFVSGLYKPTFPNMKDVVSLRKLHLEVSFPNWENISTIPFLVDLKLSGIPKNKISFSDLKSLKKLNIEFYHKSMFDWISLINLETLIVRDKDTWEYVPDELKVILKST